MYFLLIKVKTIVCTTCSTSEYNHEKQLQTYPGINPPRRPPQDRESPSISRLGYRCLPTRRRCWRPLALGGRHALRCELGEQHALLKPSHEHTGLLA